MVAAFPRLDKSPQHTLFSVRWQVRDGATLSLFDAAQYTLANMYSIPIGLFVRGDAHVIERAGQQAEQLADLTWTGFFIHNLFPVTLGNIVGGAVMVAAVYWFVYVRERPGNRLVRMWQHVGLVPAHADRATDDPDGE
jgi:Formate/nitrite transporter